MTGSDPGGLATRVRALDTRARILGVVAGVVLLSAVGVVASTTLVADATEPPILIEMATPTPVATVATPLPTSTPTPVPSRGPIPAAEIPLGDTAGLENLASAHYPLPPPYEVSPRRNLAKMVRIIAPALGIDHAIVTVGVEDGQMLSPDEDGEYMVGWYQSGGGYSFGMPGFAGNAVFSAHETWNHYQGPFYGVHRARVGDEIFLQMEDGEMRRYQVARVTRYATDEMPMAEVLWPSDRPEREEWITLYTCGGEIVYDETGFGDYLSRDVLVAKWVGPRAEAP